jgi:hypothetical protein
MNRLTSSATLFFGPAIPSPTRLSIGTLAAATKGLEERHGSEGGYGTKKMPGTPVKKVETSHNLAGDRPWQTLLYPAWYTILCSDFIVPKILYYIVYKLGIYLRLEHMTSSWYL